MKLAGHTKLPPPYIASVQATILLDWKKLERGIPRLLRICFFNTEDKQAVWEEEDV